MGTSLQRLDSLAKPDSFDDQKTAAQVAASEGASADYAQFQEALLSQLKRIIHGDQAGNWYDDPASIHGADASLYGLLDGLTQVDEKPILSWRFILGDLVVPPGQNYVTITAAGALPVDSIAIAATTLGAVAAQLSTPVGVHSLDQISGEVTIQPKNLVAVFNGDTGEGLFSDGKPVWGLLQVGAAATDGNAFATHSNDLGQISFIRYDSTFDSFEAAAIADVQGRTIVYAYSRRTELGSTPEEAFRTDVGGGYARPDSGTFRFNVAPAGVQNGVNTVYTAPENFDDNTIQVHVNGMRMAKGASNDYTTSESGGVGTGYDTVTLVFAPIAEDQLLFDYAVA